MIVLKNQPCVAVFLLEWDFQIHTEQLVEALPELGFNVHLYLHGTENTGVHSVDRIAAIPGVKIFNSCDLLTNELTGLFRGTTNPILSKIKNRFLAFCDPFVFAFGAKGPSWFAWTSKQYPIPADCSAKYAFAIGVEDAGFVWASSIMHGRCPVFLHSLELFTQKHAMYYGWRFIALRRRVTYWMRRASGIIIQDRFRAEVLIQASGLEHRGPKVYELPVSIKSRRPAKPGVSLRERLGLPSKEIIIVYIGNLTPIRMCAELCEQADSLPMGCTLVLHGRWMGPPEYNERLTKFRGHPRVRFSEELVDEGELGDLVGGCDIGLALYDNVNLNYYHTGYASEKIALYLSRGIPIITFNYPSNIDCFTRWKCGVTIEQMEEIPTAIMNISASFMEYRKAAVAAFAECYDFEAAKRILEVMAKDACGEDFDSCHASDGLSGLATLHKHPTESVIAADFPVGKG